MNVRTVFPHVAFLLYLATHTYTPYIHIWSLNEIYRWSSFISLVFNFPLTDIIRFTADHVPLMSHISMSYPDKSHILCIRIICWITGVATTYRVLLVSDIYIYKSLFGLNNLVSLRYCRESKKLYELNKLLPLRNWMFDFK